MKEERFIDGRRCRLYSSELYYMGDYYSDKKFWIADTGDFVVCEGDNEEELIPCDIGCSRSGPFIEEMSYEGYLDSKVMALFGPPQPDWDIHSRHLPVINHKDGNWMNCNINNLEWVPYHYRHSNAAREFVDYYGDIYEVHSTGKVFMDGVDLPVRPEVVSNPFNKDSYWALYIYDGHQCIKVEELMKKAGYVQGDDANLVHPVILHIDGDYKNNNTNNLEWVEEYDPRYINYLRKRQRQILLDEKMMEFKRNNPWQDEWDIDELPENPPAPFTPPGFSNYGEALGPIDWAKIDPITGTPIDSISGAPLDPITGQPNEPQVQSFPGWPKSPSAETSLEPNTPPSSSGFGDAPDIGVKPFKPR